MKTLKVEQNNNVLLTTIDRPQALNAINFRVMDDLEEILKKIEGDSSVRALIMRGAGDEAFISGGDLREFHTLKTAQEAKEMARRMLAILERIEQLPCWTVACINGPTYGGGWEMVLAFDFRLASVDATFGFTQGKFYLPPGWGGLTRLVGQVGRSTALRWLAEAATVDAKTALQHKLVDELHPQDHLMQATRDFVQGITKNDREFIRNLKQGAYRASEVQRKAMEAEINDFARFWEHDRHMQRVETFLRRKEKEQ